MYSCCSILWSFHSQLQTTVRIEVSREINLNMRQIHLVRLEIAVIIKEAMIASLIKNGFNILYYVIILTLIKAICRHQYAHTSNNLVRRDSNLNDRIQMLQVRVSYQQRHCKVSKVNKSCPEWESHSHRKKCQWTVLPRILCHANCWSQQWPVRSSQHYLWNT